MRKKLVDLNGPFFRSTAKARAKIFRKIKMLLRKKTNLPLVRSAILTVWADLPSLPAYNIFWIELRFRLYFSLFVLSYTAMGEMIMDKLNPQNLRVVVFDWDGTLVESRTPRLYAINKVMAECKMGSWEQTQPKQNPRLSFMDNFPLVFGTRAADIYDKYCDVYKQCVGKMIYAFAGVKETLDLLQRHGIKIVIMTNKDRKLFDFELPLVLNPPYFDQIVCGHEAARDKPYPEHALRALEGIIAPGAVSPDTVWVVGDSILDNLCALAVNAKPIRLCNGFPDCEKVASGKVWYFDSFDEFYRQLKSELEDDTTN